MAHAGELRVEVSGDVARRFLEGSDRQIQILTPTSRSSAPIPFTTFDAEPGSDANPDDIASWDERRDFALRDGLAADRSGTIRLVDDSSAVSIRLQLRRTTTSSFLAELPQSAMTEDEIHDDIF
jgi:hypothetical protein